MKKLLILVALMSLTVTLKASTTKERGSLGKLSSTIAEFSDVEGFDVVSVGRIGTAAVKSLARLAYLKEDGDKDATEVMKLIGGVRKVAVVDFDDCKEADKAKFKRKIERILTEDCLVMEAKDGRNAMKIFGVLDEKVERFDNFVLYAPEDCALICLFGTIPLSAVSRDIPQ